MAVASTLSDFVGYSVGVPHVVPPATVGYVGLLDFTGLPVGVPEVIPPVPVIGSHMGARVVQQGYRKSRRYMDDDDIIILLK